MAKKVKKAVKKKGKIPAGLKKFQADKKAKAGKGKGKAEKKGKDKGKKKKA
jgi:hypothetical protein